MSGATDFEIAAAWLLSPEIEGTVGRIASDPGGLTKWGIASKWYPEVLRDDFTKDDALAIYRRRYWDACACDEMPPWLALMTFDAAVQHSPRTAVYFLQRALRVTADGMLGPETRAAMAQAKPGALGGMIDQRLARYLEQSRAEWAESGRGWMRRLVAVTRECLIRLQQELTA